MQNSGLAIVLAKQAFPLLPLAPVVGAVSAVMHSLLGSLLAVAWRGLFGTTAGKPARLW
jgi:BASS family bile acid:Na+ symporter